MTKRQRLPIAVHVCGIPDGPYRYGGWYFEIHPYCGPTPLLRNGNPILAYLPNAAPAGQAAPDEVAWLIERPRSKGALSVSYLTAYVDGGDGIAFGSSPMPEQWTDDAYKAKRYRSKEDADLSIRVSVVDKNCYSVEHRFCARAERGRKRK